MSVISDCRTVLYKPSRHIKVPKSIPRSPGIRGVNQDAEAEVDARVKQEPERASYRKLDHNELKCRSSLFSPLPGS